MAAKCREVVAVLGLVAILGFAPAASAQETSGAPPDQPDPVGRPEPQKESPPEIAILADEGGILTPKGTFILEPSFEYTHSSTLRVALEGFTVIPGLNIGVFDIRDIDRDTIILALTGRYGITSRLEVELKLPYVWSSDTTRIGPTSPGSTGLVSDVDGDGFGDVELALHYQFNRGTDGWPFLIGNLRVKSRTGTDPFEVDVRTDPDTNITLFDELPTGSGFWAVEPSLTVILPSDPAVLFGNFSYMWNIERDINNTVGEIDPGDIIGLNLGMGFAVNERLSFSLGYDHSVVGKTKQNGSNLDDSKTLQIGKLLLGFSYRMTPRTSVNLTIGAGLTDDAPDVDVALRFPIAF